MKIKNNTRAFLSLVKAGLWESEVHLLPYGDINFNEIFRLSEEQSVIGLVAAGFEYVKDLKVPKELALSFAGEALQLEQRNTAMNRFINKLINQMRAEGIYTLLVKGQGVAQCYERPLWRACGDIDLFLDAINYDKARLSLSPFADTMEVENTERMHQGMQFGTWTVELHGSLRNGLWKKMNEGIDSLQSDTFCNKHVRIWDNNGTDVPLPSPTNDVLFVFTHILQHFFQEGVGLRQICDWCRLLWKYNDEIDKSVLNTYIDRMGIRTEWQTFSSLIVNELGMPEDAIPLYDSSPRWKRKALMVLDFIIETGNFGLNRDLSYMQTRPYLIRKFISFWRHTADSVSYFFIFPVDSLKIWGMKMRLGLMAAMRGEG